MFRTNIGRATKAPSIKTLVMISILLHEFRTWKLAKGEEKRWHIPSKFLEANPQDKTARISEQKANTVNCEHRKSKHLVEEKGVMDRLYYRVCFELVAWRKARTPKNNVAEIWGEKAEWPYWERARGLMCILAQRVRLKWCKEWLWQAGGMEPSPAHENQWQAGRSSLTILLSSLHSSFQQEMPDNAPHQIIFTRQFLENRTCQQWTGHHLVPVWIL